MSSYDRQDAIDQIVKGLSRFRPRNEIIKDVCKQYGYSWDQATVLVGEIERGPQYQVAGKRNRIGRVLGVFFILFGAMLLIASIAATIYGIYVIVARTPFLGNLLGMGIGLGMILGGIAALLKRDD